MHEDNGSIESFSREISDIVSKYEVDSLIGIDAETVAYLMVNTIIPFIQASTGVNN